MSTLIHVPKMSNIIEDGDNNATFTIEPLHSGYGMTLGNSLRRVLLSSIQGAAVTSFMIDGANHEFTTIEGVKEDVIEITLNVKQLRFKSHSDEPITVRVSKKGAGEVTGADLKLPAELELANPEQVIAVVDKPSMTFTMDLVVETGLGYRQVSDKRDDSRPTNAVVVDALFSPIVRVRYKVGKTRVGQVADLDMLELSIETDGTVAPKDAFEEAAALLKNQYEALAGSTEIEAGEPLTEIEVADDTMENDLAMSIEDLSLSARTTNALLNNDIKIVQDLVTLNDSDLRNLKGFGAKALDEVQERLTEMDLG